MVKGFISHSLHNPIMCLADRPNILPSSSSGLVSPAIDSTFNQEIKGEECEDFRGNFMGQTCKSYTQLLSTFHWTKYNSVLKWCESHSVMSNSLWPHGLAHGIFQARILEQVASPFSRGSSQPRYENQVSHIAGRFFTSWATREAQEYWSG